MKKKSVLLLILVVIIAVILNCVAFIGFDISGFKYGGVFDENQGIRKGIDLAGGSVITFEANAANPTEEQMDIVEGIFNTRLTGAGYTEARISRDNGGQITVEIPAVTNTDEAASLLGSTAKLTFRDADGNIVLDGATDIKNAEYQYGQATDTASAAEAYVLVTLKPEAVAKFANATRQAAARMAEGKNYIAIYMDEQMISAPSVQSEINAESCIINGGFTPETAQTLANQIKSGQLPFDLSVITKETIGAELGSDALPTSMLAAGIGVLLIMLFMIALYRISGLMASIATAIYVGLIALVLGLMRVNLSLSGIAGIITSLGMAVDANVIIFERMKEELNLGKTIKASVEAGFNKAFSAILDSNVTTIITCVVLYLSGIGTIRGFAVTLGLGVVISMFTAIVVTKFLLKQLVNLNLKNRKLYGAKN
ncbi:MAG: protein translocase subunit SecD [Clostridia bacterium]|nr:protein translocase subunit SecD [Clostridia bacterium]